MEPIEIELPKIIDNRGNLTFFEYPNQIPFAIQRVYWIYDVPSGKVRGSHAFKEQSELIVALSGSFKVLLHNGLDEKSYTLSRPNMGLLVPNLIWRKIENFSTNSLALIVSNKAFDEGDYIRDFEEFTILKYGK